MTHQRPEAEPQRLVALDAYRGFAMFLMGVELLKLDAVAANFPGHALWQFIGFHAAHVAWTGCSLHDLIHPSFAFMVGVALPFSIARRLAKGQSKWQLALHAGWRALLLVMLGIFIRSLGRSSTNWTFEDTLTQIGLGYPVLFLLAFTSNKVRWASMGVILTGYWLFSVCHAVAPPELPDAAVNIPAGWPHHAEGFFAHWNLNRNAAWEFDTWFLNLFPRHRPFVGYLGGYNTLNFIPSIATMVLGLIAGTWLREVPSHKPATAASAAAIRRLILTGVALLTLGLGLQLAGICPIIKKIWTPAWMIYSGGWCYLLMAAFYYVIDVKGYRRWAYPLVVIGMNSIAMYIMFHTLDEFIAETLAQHLGKSPFLLLGPELQPMLLGASVLATLWLILLWMHHRKIYLRI